MITYHGSQILKLASIGLIFDVWDFPITYKSIIPRCRSCLSPIFKKKRVKLHNIETRMVVVAGYRVLLTCDTFGQNGVESSSLLDNFSSGGFLLRYGEDFSVMECSTCYNHVGKVYFDSIGLDQIDQIIIYNTGAIFYD